jgi:hypothetical protein
MIVHHTVVYAVGASPLCTAFIYKKDTRVSLPIRRQAHKNHDSKFWNGNMETLWHNIVQCCGTGAGTGTAGTV